MRRNAGVVWSMIVAAELPAPLSPDAVTAAGRDARLRAMVTDHFAFVWRSVRRMGVPEAGADDAAQEVFLIASRRIDTIDPGSERAFLFATARRVASTARRTALRRREVPIADASPEHPAPGPEELTDRKRARELMDQILASLDDDERAVFVLYECEGMTGPEIAKLLELRLGTVASRLRRARASYQRAVVRLGPRRRQGASDA